ncbi:pyridoxal phosphate-dependent aminotransferase [Phocicoccus pinnipedialis]|uniref:Aminotransferase n=1 Tax=Phocicoccus pinnipedialis TaxID=110845 RepID=A0A6V7RD53_9BACL|nr:pyridoxal phosphate-dependent aminotransferase [Jeotgalicoccus pinnipedialis]MBP1939383.1 aspartate aminotransferase [Jeotgalicoccus pinnipedialis]CAD2075583.1 Aspartate aminotransferase [Jeotgalicoccus pinnipedialis]
MQISKRIKTLSRSQTVEITNLSRCLKNEGIDVISLSVGEPDFTTPEEIIHYANTMAKQGNTKYVATDGLPELKLKIQEKMQRDNALSYDLDEIFVGSGAKQVLYNIFMALLDPGDEVVVPNPFWVTYTEQVKLAEGVPVIAHTTAENEYKLTPKILDQFMTEKTKILVLNSPNNPTGSVYTREELKALADYLDDKDIIVIADEIYEVLVYDGEHISIASMSEKMKKKTIVINGVSKSHAMTGWRVGYACGDREVISAITKLQSQLVSSVSTPAQYAAVAAYDMERTFLDEYNQLFRKRRDNAYKKMVELPYVECIKPQGAFYLFPYFKDTAKKCGFNTVDDFLKALLSEKHVALVPGSAFGYPNNLRLSYAVDEDTLNEAMNRLKIFINEKLENIRK